MVAASEASQSCASLSVPQSWPQRRMRSCIDLLKGDSRSGSTVLRTTWPGTPPRVLAGRSTGCDDRPCSPAPASPGRGAAAATAKLCCTHGTIGAKLPQVEARRRAGPKCQGRTRAWRKRGCSSWPPEVAGKPCTHSRNTRQSHTRQWRHRNWNSGSTPTSRGVTPTRFEPSRSAMSSRAWSSSVCRYCARPVARKLRIK
mmetsp:Transcript_41763/g.118074  ORF Transcript_41763/g.118074 Transcript_41763/m.118074 type:complete len:200 (-) Transcript_41763:725-1324(-)